MTIAPRRTPEQIAEQAEMELRKALRHLARERSVAGLGPMGRA